MPVRGHDGASFSAGWDCGTRVAAVVARAAALELVEHARWWNRWRRRLMARALVACAEELERMAEEDVEGLRSQPRASAAPRPRGLPADVLALRDRLPSTPIH
jgi:hypothetical protein